MKISWINVVIFCGLLPSFIGLVLGLISKEKNWKKAIISGAWANVGGCALMRLLTDSLNVSFESAVLISGPIIAIGQIVLFRAIVIGWRVKLQAKKIPQPAPSIPCKSEAGVDRGKDRLTFQNYVFDNWTLGWCF